ncbi:MAG: DMT family transporter [Rhodobacterales bacterium]|nr:MAG: DMT family transporter [Rhodobacterales bacterium]
MLRDAGIMLAAGVGIPILAALNAQLGGRIGAPMAAGVVAMSVALVVAVAAVSLTGQARALALVVSQPLWLLLAGVLMAFYLLSITWIAPRFGVGNAEFCVLLGQMLAAAVIDHFGLFGARIVPMNGQRLAGILTMAGGLVLIQRA